jgi:hypothetical protein
MMPVSSTSYGTIRPRPLDGVKTKAGGLKTQGVFYEEKIVCDAGVVLRGVIQRAAAARGLRERKASGSAAGRGNIA